MVGSAGQCCLASEARGAVGPRRDQPCEAQTDPGEAGLYSLF